MIRFYDIGDLKSKFVGYRVVISVNGTAIQSYFALSKYEKKEAYNLAVKEEERLLLLQLKYQQNNAFSKETNTGIVGLNIGVDKKSNRHSVQKRIQYSILRDEVATHKSWYITNTGLTNELWIEICGYIKNARNADDATFKKMLALQPTKEHLDKEFTKLMARYN